MHHFPKDENKSKQELLVERFLNFMQKHYKEELDMDFYATKPATKPPTNGLPNMWV